MTITRGMPISVYHARPGFLNHSKLKDFERSPWLFHQRHVVHSSDFADRDSVARQLGRAFEPLLYACLSQPAHASVDVDTAVRAVNEHSDGEQFVARPEGPAGNFATKAGKEWKAAHEARGLTILDRDSILDFQRMISSVLEHDAVPLLRQAEKQVTLDYDTGIGWGIQSRPDFVSLEGCVDSEFRPYSIDLKTTSDLGQFRRDIATLGYYRQAEMVRASMERNGARDPSVMLLAVEKSAPHRCEVYELMSDYLVVAASWVIDQLMGIDHCTTANVWPKGRPGIIQLHKPHWLKASGEETT